MYKLFLTIFAISAIFISCDKNNTVLTGYGNVELVFKAKFDTIPLVYGNDYNYFGLGTIRIGTADFFYSTMKLSNANDSVLVKELDYVYNDNIILQLEDGKEIQIPLNQIEKANLIPNLYIKKILNIVLL